MSKDTRLLWLIFVLFAVCCFAFSLGANPTPTPTPAPTPIVDCFYVDPVTHQIGPCPAPTVVPTLDQWAVVALVACLAVAGVRRAK